MIDQSDGAFGSTGAGFTAGPWTLDYDMLAGGHILVCTSDYGVAKVYDEEAGSHDTNMANARLIAAAPDLLAALEQLCGNAEVCRFMIDTGEDEGKAICASALFDTIQQARAAIALATGAAA